MLFNKKPYILFRVVIGQLVTFLLFCTVLGFSQNWLKQNNVDGKIIPILAQFSLFNSSLKILSTKENSGYISAIHGIRALSILWVAYGHEIYFNFITSYVNFREFLDVSFSLSRIEYNSHWVESIYNNKINILKVLFQFLLIKNSQSGENYKSIWWPFSPPQKFFPSHDLSILSKFDFFCCNRTVTMARIISKKLIFLFSGAHHGNVFTSLWEFSLWIRFSCWVDSCYLIIFWEKCRRVQIFIFWNITFTAT